MEACIAWDTAQLYLDEASTQCVRIVHDPRYWYETSRAAGIRLIAYSVCTPYLVRSTQVHSRVTQNLCVCSQERDRFLSKRGNARIRSRPIAAQLPRVRTLEYFRH